MTWFKAADALRLEAQGLRMRNAGKVSDAQIEAATEALRIFSHDALDRLRALMVADALEVLAGAFDRRGRDEITPTPVLR